MEKTRYKKITIKKKIFFSFVVLLLFLLIIELFSYAALSFFCLPFPSHHSGETSYITQDPDLGWSLVPGASHHILKYPQGYDITIHIGNGFRKDNQNIRRVRECDIITIGDSHTFGFGIKEDQTLAFQLHSLLSDDEHKCLVFNGGVPSYGLDQYYLRLRSLGHLKKDSLVIVYINPINDIRNLSRDIDYGSPRPYARLAEGGVEYIKPILYDPKTGFHFAPDFDSLNQAFSVSTPTPPPSDLTMFQKSQIWQLFSGLRDKKFRFRWSQIEPTEAIDTYQDGWEHEQIRQRYAQREQLKFAAGQWSEISEFEHERRVVEEMLFGILCDMKRHIENQQAHLLVVISDEAYTNQGFNIRIRDILKQQLPQYTFGEGWSRQVVRRAAQKANVDSLMIEYPVDRIESMFIPYDGHTSADGFSFTAQRIVEWIDEQQFAFVDGKRSLEAVVQEDPDINSLDGNGYTRLHYAVQNGNYQTVERLISEGADINSKDRWGETPFYIAAARGYKSILEMLIDKGADVNTTDHRDQSPLHQAVSNGHKDIVELLITNNVNVNPINKTGQTPLDIILSLNQRQISQNPNFGEIKELLISNGAEISSIHAAAQVGDLDKVVASLKRGTDINSKNERGQTPLHIAIINNQKDIVELLIKGGADINAENNRQRTPIDLATMRDNREIVQLLAKVVNISSIHLATQFGNLEKVRSFLEQGIDINSKDEDGDTPLIIAVNHDNNDIAEFLIENRADVNTGDEGNYTPLYYAIWNLNKDMVNLLINKGAEANFSAQEGDSVLYEAVWMGNFDIVEILVDNGAKYDVKDENGFTALHYAALQGSIDMVELFLSKGIDISSIHMTACAGDLSKVQELIEQGTEIDANDEAGWTALFWAISAGQTEVAEFLINNKADINVKIGRQNQSLLHQAAQTDSIKLVELLIAKGIDVNIQNRRGLTPLHLACQRGNKKVVEFLINKEADVNAKRNNGLTPLHLAARFGQKEIVELLISKGADINTKNNRGQTPLDLAQQRGHTEIVELLKERMPSRQVPPSDITIISVSALSTCVQGDSVPVAVTVTNKSSERQELHVALRDADTHLEIAAQALTLEPKGYRLANTADLILSPPSSCQGVFGWGMNIGGDINQDGYADLLVGAGKADQARGRVCLYYGSIDMKADPHMILEGENRGDQFARPALGDVNGDGFDDVIIGAGSYNDYDGRVYIFLSGTDMDTEADVILEGESGTAGKFSGNCLSAGDVDKDGYADVLVGSYGYDSNRGRVYLYYGGDPMDNSADVIFEGEHADDVFGRNAIIGEDIDGDGYRDILIGARKAPEGTRQGRAYLFYGGNRNHMDAVCDMILTPPSNEGHEFGSSLDIYDIDSDGYADVIVGARLGQGAVFVYWGNKRDRMDSIPDEAILGEAGAQSSLGGDRLFCADFNRDGYGDIAVGAYNWLRQNRIGRTYVYYGGTKTSIDTEPDVILTGETEGSWFGHDIGGGDFNNDGYTDLVAGAWGYSNEEGRAYVFFGPLKDDTAITFNWDTTNTSIGKHTLKVEIPPVPSEQNTEDNVKTITIEVKEPTR